MIRNRYIFWFSSIVSVLLHISTYSLPPINLFRPSDSFLIPDPMPCGTFQWTVGYEGTLTTHGFQDDNDDCSVVSTENQKEINKKVNVLHIYQNEQNALAAFKGLDSSTREGQISQLFNINDENKNQGILVLCGSFKVPLNLMFAARYYTAHGISFGLFLPVYQMELEKVRWREKSNKKIMEDRIERDFTHLVYDISHLHLKGWRRTGVGDLLGQVSWTKDFRQAKPLLTNVRTQLRFGVSVPTGLRQDEDVILGIPFGNDGLWGLQFAGRLTLTFCHYLRGGIDAEFLYLFGTTHTRRVRTNCHQTDLLFLAKVPAFREFGFSQQYNVFLETCNFLRGVSCKINYQYLKRNEDKLFICNDRIDPFIVNSAESLQEWTAHSLIFGLGYDFRYDIPKSPFTPSILGWFKWGFNGKRALLANTLGLTLTVNF